ncbi:MAG: MGMT family protein [Minisyncoccales bacterium]|jgi:O-6-methylguanine DNA methyltransferase
MTFRDRVLEIVSQIPKGSVLSYGQVAEMAGNKRAARAVGRIMNANRNKLVPCHRVIRSDGSIGGFRSGADRKAKMLKEEGYKGDWVKE